MLRPSRTLDRSAPPHECKVVRDPPDLGAIADASRSLRPDTARPKTVEAGFPLMGLSKDRPSIVQAAESAPSFRRSRSTMPHTPSPVTRRLELPGAREPTPARDPSPWFLTTSTVSSSTTLRPYFRTLPILGFIAFPSVAKRNFPRCSFCPSKPSLRRQRRVSGCRPLRIESRHPVGPRHHHDRCRPIRHREPCPHTLSPSSLRAGSRPLSKVSAVYGKRAGASRPCSIVGSVARRSVSGPTRSVLPWAWPICPRRQSACHP